MAPTKERITCHVLDTSTGRPAPQMRVRLSGAPEAMGTNAPKTFESLTDEDGRIKSWLPYSDAVTSGEVPVYTLEDVLSDAEGQRGTSRWTLRFDTAGYFGGEDKTFFPEVTVVFTVTRGEGYHVPLLLAPYSYSTYRGS